MVSVDHHTQELSEFTNQTYYMQFSNHIQYGFNTFLFKKRFEVKTYQFSRSSYVSYVHAHPLLWSFQQQQGPVLQLALQTHHGHRWASISGFLCNNNMVIITYIHAALVISICITPPLVDINVNHILGPVGLYHSAPQYSTHRQQQQQWQNSTVQTSRASAALVAATSAVKQWA